MSFQSIMFNIGATINDYKRDKAIPLPEGITQCRNISYGSHGKWNLLDVYYPDGTTAPLPTIVSIHGGGYVYGSKEIYRRYGMDMARRGFAFVNFNYRLAPKWRFPTPLWIPILSWSGSAKMLSAIIWTRAVSSLWVTPQVPSWPASMRPSPRIPLMPLRSE